MTKAKLRTVKKSAVFLNIIKALRVGLPGLVAFEIISGFGFVFDDIRRIHRGRFGFGALMVMILRTTLRLLHRGMVVGVARSEHQGRTND